MNAVIIADYDPEWPRRFEEERARILEALHGLDVTVEHVGSTSVPGLGAKPIIDIMIMVTNAESPLRSENPLDYTARTSGLHLSRRGRDSGAHLFPQRRTAHVSPLPLLARASRNRATSLVSRLLARAS